MADRSHLTPTTIVDRRGRTTTVHRSPGRENQPGAASALPHAVLPSAEPVPGAAAALRQPSSRRKREMREFFEGAERRWVFFHSHSILRFPQGVRATALAMDLVEDGELDMEAAVGILAKAQANTGSSLAEDMLRVASRFNARSAGLGTDEAHWAYRVFRAVTGCRVRNGDRDAPPIATQGQLDALEALTEFVLRFADDPDHFGLIRRAGHTVRGGNRLEGDIIANPHLDQLIRSRPHDLNRIIAYTAERGIDAESSETVDELRAWLDEEPSAVGEGWL